MRSCRCPRVHTALLVVLASAVTGALAGCVETLDTTPTPTDRDAGAPTSDAAAPIGDAAAPTTDGGPTLPVVDVENRVCTEGDIGEQFCSIPIRLSAPAPRDVVVFVELDPATTTATQGVDFRMSTFGVTIAAGQRTAEIPVAILGDRTIEPTELVAYRISSVTGAAQGISRGSIQIIDNDTPAPTATSSALYTGRGFHTATALPDGRVILVGGYVNGAIVNTIDVIEASGTSHAFPANLAEPRQRHTASLLSDGRILIVGGATQGSTTPLATTALIDPAAGTVTPGPSLNAARYLHSAVSLSDGRVLIAGGVTSLSGGSCLSSGEVFWPRSSATAPDRVIFTENGMPSPADSMAAVRAADGSVFFLGGACSNTRKIVRYVPGTGFRLEPGRLHVNRTTASASLLPDGRVFLAGGMDTASNVVLDSTEILDARTATTIDGPTLGEARYDHRVVTLPSGRVVISGGTYLNGGVRARGTVEVYESASNTMRTAFTFVEPRAYHGVVNFNERVLHIGGYLNEGGLARSLATYEVTTFGP